MNSYFIFQCIFIPSWNFYCICHGKFLVKIFVKFMRFFIFIYNHLKIYNNCKFTLEHDRTWILHLYSLMLSANFQDGFLPDLE